MRTSLAYAFTEDAPAGDHFWCVFPDRQSQWAVVLYEKRRQWVSFLGYRDTYAPLVQAIKAAGADGSAYYQMMTVPPHKSRVCLLVVYRNGVQQPYRGWTAFNPYGWHTFGVIQPLQTIIAEIPPRVRPGDIRYYERFMRGTWSLPLH